MNNELLQLLQQVNPAVWYTAPIFMIAGGLLIKRVMNNKNMQFQEESYVPLAMSDTSHITQSIVSNNTHQVSSNSDDFVIDNKPSTNSNIAYAPDNAQVIVESETVANPDIETPDIDKQMAQLSTLATTQDAQYRKETDADETKFKKAFGHLISEEFNGLYPQGGKNVTSTAHAVWVTYMVRDENMKVFADAIFELKHAWGTYDAVTDLKIALKLKHPHQQTAVVSVFVVHK